MPAPILTDAHDDTALERRWLRHGLTSLAVVLVITFGAWYLLADPETSPLDVYPLPFNAAVFWALMFVVWSGFNLEFAGFTKLAQPARGAAIAVATVVFAVAVTWALSEGYGQLNPDFAADRDGGLGYFTGALFVLFGFSTYVLAVINWNHWPWTDLGFKQPMVGLCEIAFLLLPTGIVYLILGVPSVSASLDVGGSIMSLDTVLGWYYCVVVSIILTGLLLENWPWRLAGSRRNVALVSIVGNLVVATVLYFALRGLAHLLLGADVADALGSGINQYPAQIGVCWVAWMILWANAFGNMPTRLGDGANMVARTLITLVLAVATFVLYYYVLAERLLHEPPVAGKISGNALGFVDLFILATLVYVVAFESYPRTSPAADLETDGARGESPNSQHIATAGH